MRIHSFTSSTLIALVAAWLIAPPGHAQTVTLAGTNYTENFDGLGSGLPNGWTVWDNATTTSLGTGMTLDATPTAWLLAAAGLFYNMASTGNTNPDTGDPFTQNESPTIQAAATNRAPGMRLHSSRDPGAAFVVQIQDTLGFTDFQLRVDLMMMTTNSRTGVWTVDFAVGAAPVSFTPLGYLGDLTMDGTNVLNTGAFGKTNGTFSLPGTVSDQGENLWIRVALLTGTGPTGSRDAYGIDNFSLGWTAVPPSTNQPAIDTQPQSRTNDASTLATFTVSAAGAGPLHYQWRKGGTPLVDGGNISGANASTLLVSSVLAADAGGYTVVVTNSVGSITSAPAALVVVDPTIIASPVHRTNIAGALVESSGMAAGTPNLNFRWLRNGVEVPGESRASTNRLVNETIVITNAATANAGDYALVVSNAQGVVTSAVARLTLLPTPAQRIAQWTFNSDSLDADPGTGMTTPAVGTGTAAILSGNTESFLGGSVSDPASLGADNSGWNIKGYPVQGMYNKEGGVQFNLSTVGYQDICVTWEQQNNTRASRYLRLQYSTDGVSFTDHDGIDLGGMAGGFVLLTDNLAGVPAVNNNPSFAFRIVAEFESTAVGATNENYVATDLALSYGRTSGAIRYDMVNVFGNTYGTLTPINLTKIEVIGGNVRIGFTAGAGDSPGRFTLQSSGTVNGGYSDDVTATVTQVSPGVFTAERALNGSQQFYRIRR